jgi:uncharacterized protein (TIGR02246 family)
MAMTTTTKEAELLELEKRYWQAIQDRDVEAAKSLTDFPCLIAGSHGVRSVEAEAYGAMMRDDRHVLRSFAIADDTQVRLLGEDVAVIAYRVHLEMTNDGKPAAQDAADASVWVRRDGRWACAAHTDSPIR